jgi:hypothetical protein
MGSKHTANLSLAAIGQMKKFIRENRIDILHDTDDGRRIPRPASRSRHRLQSGFHAAWLELERRSTLRI